MQLRRDDFEFNRETAPRKYDQSTSGVDVGFRASALFVLGTAALFFKSLFTPEKPKPGDEGPAVIDHVGAPVVGDEPVSVGGRDIEVDASADQSPGPDHLTEVARYVKVIPNSGYRSAVPEYRFAQSSAAPSNDNEPLPALRPALPLDAVSGVPLAPALNVEGGGEARQTRDPATKDEDEEGDDEAPDDDTQKTNRAPVLSGNVVLGLLAMNQVLLISQSQLLVQVTDPDGDQLAIKAVVASAGRVTEIEPGKWLYTPDHNDTGPVRISYGVSDGQISVAASASLQIAGPDIEIPTRSTTHLVGTPTDDDLIGTPEDDVIDAADGDDVIIGREGDDIIFAGAGNDRVIAGAGDDVVLAGAGDDFVASDAGDDVILGEDGDDVLLGGTGADHLEGGAGADLLYGDEGDDTLVGGAARDTIEGGSGNDVIVAAAADGDDVMKGGEGVDVLDLSQIVDDVLVDLFTGTASGDQIGQDRISGIENVIGGMGDDMIVASTERNILSGGAGSDTFVFTSVEAAGLAVNRDKILDFELGDRIYLDEIANGLEALVDNEVLGSQKARFSLIDSADAFTRPGQIKFVYFDAADEQPGYTVLMGNTDIDEAPEFEIEIGGRYVFTDSDFTIH